MNHGKSSLTKRGRSPRVSVLRVVGGAVLVLAAVGIISQLHDIRRYWNMVRM